MKHKTIIPKSYKPILDFKETERAILSLKNFFQQALSKKLNLMRITAPLFVRSQTGINDDLNGVEKPVSFQIKADDMSTAEIVQSLAKWKRMALATHGFKPGEGIYTDMNAIRPEEILDNLHSLYVDQWDWERVMTKEQRNLEFLKAIVTDISEAIKETELFTHKIYPALKPILPDQIYFVHAEELEDMYPTLTPKERENEICKKHKAVFIIGIGGTLKSGQPHDGRAADYDDWSTPTIKDYKGINGDIVVWNAILECAFELSSMGIRVDKKALELQLELRKQTEKRKFMFHQKLLNDELPLSIGGGLGQSRLCMFFLRKAHIGEVQSSIWPEEMIKECKKHNIVLY